MSPSHLDNTDALTTDRECQNSRLGRWGLILRRNEQITMFAILIGCIFVLSSYFLHLQLKHGKIIDVDEMDYRAAAYSVDINTADWPEIANIPSIGEKLAKAIVGYRIQHGEFSDLSQLTDVPGIGPSKHKRICEYALPLNSKRVGNNQSTQPSSENSSKSNTSLSSR